MGNCCAVEQAPPPPPPKHSAPCRYAPEHLQLDTRPESSSAHTHSSAKDSLATDVTTLTRSTMRISTRHMSASFVPCDACSDGIASTDLHSVGFHQDPALADQYFASYMMAPSLARLRDEETGSMTDSDLYACEEGKCTKEPSPSKLARRIKIITLKARLLHGIDGVADDCNPAKSPDQLTQTQLLESHSLRVRERVTAKIALEEGGCNGANSVASEAASLVSGQSSKLRSQPYGSNTSQSLFSPPDGMLSPTDSTAILPHSSSRPRTKRLTPQVLEMQAELEDEADCDALALTTPMACVHAWVVAVEEEVARCALLGIPTFPTAVWTSPSTVSESSCNLSLGNSVMSRSHRQRYSLEASGATVDDGVGAYSAPNGTFGARPPIAAPSPPPQHACRKLSNRTISATPLANNNNPLSTHAN